MPVSHDLKFNVARIDNHLFQIHLLISECLLGFMTGAVEGRLQARFVMRSAHSPAAATANRLYHHRITKLPCDFYRIFLCLNDSIAARCNRYASLACSRTSSVLIAHCLHRMRGRPDELDVTAFADFHEMGVLGEEAVTWMNRFDVAVL